MEFKVLSHQGLSQDSILSVRSGKTRRQARLSELDKPLKFPNAPDNMKIDVLDMVGTTRVAYSPAQTEYLCQLDADDGQPIPDKQVVVEVKASDKAVVDAFDDADNDAKKESAARDYLDQHGLGTFMQFLLQSLMKDKPEKPYAFLHAQVTKRMVAELSLNKNEAELDSLVSRVYESIPTEVTPEQVQKLGREAAAARDQLQADQDKLQETASQLRAQYGAVAPGAEQWQPIVSSVTSRGSAEELSRRPGPEDSLQLAAYKEIAGMQDEVSVLAKENSALVQQLASMRAAIDAARAGT